MEPHLGRAGKEADAGVRVGVAGKEEALEEEHAGRPDRRRAAEPGQNELPDDRLDLEEEKRAERDREGEMEPEPAVGNQTGLGLRGLGHAGMQPACWGVGRGAVAVGRKPQAYRSPWGPQSVFRRLR